MAWAQRDEPELYAWYVRFDGRVNDAGQAVMDATVVSAHAAASAYPRAEAWTRTYEPEVHERFAPRAVADSSAARLTAREKIVDAAPLMRMDPSEAPWGDGDVSAALTEATRWAARAEPELLDRYHAALEAADTPWQKTNVQTAMIGAHRIAPELAVAVAWAQRHDLGAYQDYLRAVDAAEELPVGPWERLHAQARLVDTVADDPDGAAALAQARRDPPPDAPPVGFTPGGDEPNPPGPGAEPAAPAEPPADDHLDEVADGDVEAHGPVDDPAIDTGTGRGDTEHTDPDRPETAESADSGGRDLLAAVVGQVAEATARAWEVTARLGQQQDALTGLRETLVALRTGQVEVEELTRAAREGIDDLQLRLAGDLGELERVIDAHQHATTTLTATRPDPDGAGAGEHLDEVTVGSRGVAAGALVQSRGLLEEAAVALAAVQGDPSVLRGELPAPSVPAPGLPEDVAPVTADACGMVTRAAALSEGARAALSARGVDHAAGERSVTAHATGDGAPPSAVGVHPAPGVCP